MSYLTPRTSAEAVDRLSWLTGLGAGLASLIYALSAAEALASPDMAVAIDWIAKGAAIVLIGAFLPLFIWFKRRAGAPSMNPVKADSFLANALRKAGFTAFALTLLGTILLSLMDNLILSRITPEIALDFVVAGSLMIFALAFVIFASGPGDGVD